jgi:hypothetical protein
MEASAPTTNGLTPLRDPAERCVVCLDPVSERCESLPCRHRNFDLLCLTTWLQHRPVCPVCNGRVSEVQYGLHGDGKQPKMYVITSPRKSPSPTRRVASSSTQRRHQDSPVQRRRLVYRHRLYSLHVGSNRRQRPEPSYRELSPRLFRTDPDLVSKARLWLRRELRVFESLEPSKADFLLEYIVAILKTLDTQRSTVRAEDIILEFLGRDNTRILLHELRAWLRSPFRRLCEWDRAVQYGRNPDSRVTTP